MAELTCTKSTRMMQHEVKRIQRKLQGKDDGTGRRDRSIERRNNENHHGVDTNSFALCPCSEKVMELR